MPQQMFFFFVGSFVSLFSIVDPLMAVPVFASLTQNYTSAQRKATARRASFYVLGVLLVFFIAGGLILKFFGISLEGLRIAGGLMIIGSSVEMLRKEDRLQADEQRESESRDDISFTPLAMPILSGPGAIAVIIGMTTDVKGPLDYGIILLTILTVVLSCYITMRLSNFIFRRLGTTLMKSFTRIMGFILLCIGVQYILNGILPLLKNAAH